MNIEVCGRVFKVALKQHEMNFITDIHTRRLSDVAPYKDQMCDVLAVMDHRTAMLTGAQYMPDSSIGDIAYIGKGFFHDGGFWFFPPHETYWKPV